MSMLRKPLVVLSNAAAGSKGLSWDLAVLGVVANIIRLIIPQNGVDNIRQFLCDMPNGIHDNLRINTVLMGQLMMQNSRNQSIAYTDQEHRKVNSGRSC